MAVYVIFIAGQGDDSVGKEKPRQPNQQLTGSRVQ